MSRSTIGLTNPIFHFDNKGRIHRNHAFAAGPVCPRCRVTVIASRRWPRRGLRPGGV